MLINPQKLEDVKWLEELLGLYPKALKDKNPNLPELVAEIKATRTRIQADSYPVVHRQALAYSPVKV